VLSLCLLPLPGGVQWSRWSRGNGGMWMVVRGCRWMHKLPLLSPLGISKRQALKQKVSFFLIKIERKKTCLPAKVTGNTHMWRRIFLFLRGNFTFPPELPPIYTKPPDTKKLSDTPPIFQILSLRTLLVVSCPLYPPLQNYAVLGSFKTTPFWAKRRSFANFRIFFFNEKKKEIKKKKKKKKKKKEKSGWLEPPLAQKMGWPDHPIFGQGVAGHPIPAVWGWPKPPQAFGGGPATPKGQKKKKNKKNGFGILGVAGPPPRAWGWLRTPPTGRRGWLRPPLGPWGWSGHPQNPKPIFFVFFFGLSGWSDHPHTAGMGWPATPWPKMGWSGHPIFWARGGSSHPDFSLLFFFIFFFFNFLLFFIKKKNPKICKTTPFCPKRRRFAQNGVVLEWRV
jgi:hypothetical protein